MTSLIVSPEECMLAMLAVTMLHTHWNTGTHTHTHTHARTHIRKHTPTLKL